MDARAPEQISALQQEVLALKKQVAEYEREGSVSLGRDRSVSQRAKLAPINANSPVKARRCLATAYTSCIKGFSRVQGAEIRGGGDNAEVDRGRPQEHTDEAVGGG